MPMPCHCNEIHSVKKWYCKARRVKVANKQCYIPVKCCLTPRDVSRIVLLEISELTAANFVRSFK